MSLTIAQKGKKMPRQKVISKAVWKLLFEVDDLCAVYCGKDAESEEWGKTCERLRRIDKLRKKARSDLVDISKPVHDRSALVD